MNSSLHIAQSEGDPFVFIRSPLLFQSLFLLHDTFEVMFLSNFVCLFVYNGILTISYFWPRGHWFAIKHIYSYVLIIVYSLGSLELL